MDIQANVACIRISQRAGHVEITAVDENAISGLKAPGPVFCRKKSQGPGDQAELKFFVPVETDVSQYILAQH